MVKPWGRLVSPDGSADSLTDLRQQLDRIDKSVDWTRFDRYLRWLDPLDERIEGHPPIRLFKALLIQRWYALIAIEYDYFLNDSIACRRFVGLQGEQRSPSQLTVANFHLLLADRGVAQEVYAELDRQLRALGLSDLVRETAGAERTAASPFRRLPRHIVPSPKPPEWTEIESVLFRYWRRAQLDRRMPTLADIRLSRASEIRPHAVLIGVMRERNDFSYDFLGRKVVEGNQGDATGTTVGEKEQHNLRRYGSGGLQSELAATFVGAVMHRRPVSISADFVNAGLKRCQIWGAVLPLTGADDGDVEMLLGISLIKPILFN